MRILGIDPGLRVTGYAVVSAAFGSAEGIELIEAGVIRTPGPTHGIAARLAKLHESLAELIEETSPEVMVMEKLFSHYKHPATAIPMAHARGVVCLCAGKGGVSLKSIAPTHVKKAITGAGHASKEQVKRSIEAMLGLRSTGSPADATDALAIAVAWAFNSLPRRLPRTAVKVPA